ARFDNAVAANYNIGFLFASGPFTLHSQTRERFSLALAYGADLPELRTTVSVVQAIYNASYQFSVPPPTPTVKAEAGDHYVQLTWDDVAENATNPIVGYNAFEGYRIYKSTDPDFLDPKVILTARGTTTIGNGKPVAQFDLVDGKAGYTSTAVGGVAYFLGSETGLTHSWRDTAVDNGQQYYYAVCSYDWGPTLTRGTADFTYYPSESAIAVSRTLRGGTILPKNVVAVRPDPKVLGYKPADVSQVTRVSGKGIGSVSVRMVQSPLVPDNHLFTISFNSDPDSVHASTYTLRDSTTHTTLFTTGNVFDSSANGQVGLGLMPVIYTLPTIVIDPATGWAPGATTNAKLSVVYKFDGMPINHKRKGFPDDITIIFSDHVIDTSAAAFPAYDAQLVKFTVIGHSASGDQKLPFLFLDLDNDSTLSHVPGGQESIIILSGPDTLPVARRMTWTVQLTGDNAQTRPPSKGDVFNLILDRPFTTGDVFAFTSKGAVVAADLAKQQFQGAPYVVPNPYVGAASFEPAPFGVQGRGDRRMEFRNVPVGATVRIYTVRGDLVQTLRQDGSVDGFIPWDLRTKDNLDVAPGLYIFHVDGGGAGTYIGKFAIIK
ncbi:MAG TPA: hypothetical protein VF889_04665, partial [Bacteroidota bacterium]